MSYNVPLRMLSITPTRDGLVNPSRRLPDKHIRPLCGKTLDEWAMLQLWSSKYVKKAIFVCETKGHAERLAPLAERYGITLIVRPYDFNHSLNDSGIYPVLHALDAEMRSGEYYSVVTTPFVIAPCRPPGFFDAMVEEYARRAEVHDFSRGVPILLGCSSTQYNTYIKGADGRGTQLAAHIANPYAELRQSVTNHWVANTYWFWISQMIYLSHLIPPEQLVSRPMLMEIEPWTDIHIDSEDEWEWAEYWFREKILSRGEDCYAQYRETWKKTEKPWLEEVKWWK